MTSYDTASDKGASSAREIAENLIQTTRQALVEDRFDLFLECFVLPMRLETFEATREVATEDDLRNVFRAVRTLYASIGVTDIDQRCIEAAFAGPDQISFTHETRLLAGQQLLQEPYPVLTDALRTADGWKMTGSSFAIVDDAKHINALMGRT